MRKHTDYVEDREGNAVAGAEVYVRLQSDNSLLDLFSDDGVTTLANPVTTDNDGEFSFYTDDNTVKMQVFISGVQQQEVNHFQHYDLTGFLKASNNLSDVASVSTVLTNLGLVIGTDVAAFDATVQPAEWAPNFTADGEVRIFANGAMTITEVSTSGTGTSSYEKSTTAAPGTFASTSSPVTLEDGAVLKVLATGVDTIFAVNLVRTA